MEIVLTLNQMTFGNPKIEPPDHPLFETSRWKSVLSGKSAYFKSYKQRLQIEDGQWVLETQSNITNYNNEIELFLDWIAPYVDAEEGEFVGHQHYEESEHPRPIFFRGGDLVVGDYFDHPDYVEDECYGWGCK